MFVAAGRRQPYPVGIQRGVAKFGGQALPQQDGGRLQAAMDLVKEPRPRACVHMQQASRHLCSNASARPPVQLHWGRQPALAHVGAPPAEGILQAAVLQAFRVQC